MKLGITSFCFHRMLGEVRRGEAPAAARLADGGPAALERARQLGCEVVGLQTCYLEEDRFDPDALRAAAGDMRLVLEWGHPEGLEHGTRPDQEASLLAWLDRAAALGVELVRVVLGGSRHRGLEPVEAQIARSVEPLRRCADRAAALGLELAVENHVDLTPRELVTLLEEVDRPGVGICLDPVNAMRLGADPHDAQVAPLVRVLHLRDVAQVQHAEDPLLAPACVPFGTGIMPLAETLDRLAGPLAGDAPVLVEIAQVGAGSDELLLVADGLGWLRGYRAARPRTDPQRSS